MGFEEGEEESTFNRLRVINSKGQTILEDSNIALTEEIINGAKIRRADREVPKSDAHEKRVSIDISVTEVGQDHWCLMTFNNLSPTNNFQLFLNCDEYVEIKKYSVFFVDAEYSVQLSKDKKNIQISTNQWINEGTGLTILMALPHAVSSDFQPQSLPQGQPANSAMA